MLVLKGILFENSVKIPLKSHENGEEGPLRSLAAAPLPRWRLNLNLDFILSCLGVEGCPCHAAVFGGFRAGDFPGFPFFVLLPEAAGQAFFGAAEADALGLGGGDALCLPLADAGTLVFRDEGEDLQDNVAEECPHQILAAPCVQQGHVCLCQVETKNLFLCCELSPGPAPRPIEEMRP